MLLFAARVIVYVFGRLVQTGHLETCLLPFKMLNTLNWKVGSLWCFMECGFQEFILNLMFNTTRLLLKEDLTSQSSKWIKFSQPPTTCFMKDCDRE